MIGKYIKFIVISFSMILPFGLIFFFYSCHQPLVIDMQKITDKENVVSVLVIGSGCAGFSAAVYGARGNVKTVVITGDQPLGQLGGTTRVENMPGLIDQLGPDIVQKIQKQAEGFGAEVIYASVVSVDFSQWPYLVTTNDGKKMYALTIVIATGASPAKLNIPGEQQFWGKGVTTCAICDAPFHKGKDVVVIGGGDSAIEEASQLSSYAKNITIVVRKDKMRAAESMQDRLKTIDNVKVLFDTQVVAIHGNENDGVTGIELLNNKTNTIENRSVSGVFLAIGHIPNSELFKDALKIDSNGYIITKERSQATSLPGVFAAGDIEDKVYRQAGVAAGSGIKAALDALAFLQHHGFNAAIAKKIEPNYFTSKKITNNEVNKPLVAQLHSKTEFDQMRTQQHILVADFYTGFCPSCKFMMPTFEQVAQKFADKVTFIKIDADEVRELSQRYRIATVPTLLLFKDGELIDRLNEAVSEGELTAFVQQAF